MQTPRIFICYAPRGGGLRCALAYLPAGGAVRGWYLGRSERGLESAYFEIEGYYSRGEMRFRAVPEGELHSTWIDDAAAHELAALQEALVNEWLFYADEPGAALQLAAYGELSLPAGEVGVRADKLTRLDQTDANWTYYSAGFEHGVLEALSKRWTLDLRAVPA